MRAIKLMVFTLLSIAIAAGCSRSKEENFLSNADFSAWAAPSSPDAWKIEGDGVSLKKTDFKVEETGSPAAEFSFHPDAVVLNSPFLHQGAKETERLWGKRIRAGAWVKTDTPDAVFVEVSNRAGTDIKSRTHPGGGRWQYLDLSWDVPNNTPLVEFRLRFKRPAAALFGNPVVSSR